MTTPVSFEIAKLLKEKRFGGGQMFYYPETKELTENHRGDNYPAPTIAEVVMWLYEKHGIWISVDWMTRKKPFNSGFYCHLRGTSKPLSQDNFIVINDTLDPGYKVFNSPTEAYEAAIKYCLEKIIYGCTKNRNCY